MSFVAVEGHRIGVAWSTSLPILKDASFVLEPGFHGLVGANGAGKTTLLRVLAGELTPHEGAVRMRPADATIAYAPQDVHVLDDDVRALADREDAPAYTLRARLGLEPHELERWPSLSPGERKRWQIGAALAREPDVLLLDEPTNHLDGEARSRLIDALVRFRSAGRGVGIVVSHDRALLETLPRSILRVHNGAIEQWAGNYGAARAAWEHTRREREDAHARARSEVRSAARKLDAARRSAEAATHATSTRARMRHKHDNDARSMGAKVVAGWGEDRAGRTVGAAVSALTRAESVVPRIERDRTLGGAVFANYERAPNPVLFHLDTPQLMAGTFPVLSDVRVTIRRDDRVRITGVNGAGKTTLLRALVASLDARKRERVLLLEQELAPEHLREMLVALHGLPSAERGRVMAVLSALGSDPARVLAHDGRAGDREDAALPSPGEARKLALSMALGGHAWALVLDEPTNHLDLPTLERLEHAIAEYPGAVVLVTHDDAFAAALETRTLSVANGTVT